MCKSRKIRKYEMESDYVDLVRFAKHYSVI
jgi:hypothetical protein